MWLINGADEALHCLSNRLQRLEEEDVEPRSNLEVNITKATKCISVMQSFQECLEEAIEKKLQFGHASKVHTVHELQWYTNFKGTLNTQTFLLLMVNSFL